MITFLKLGGSIITEKTGQYAARLETIRRIAGEIAEALLQDPSIKLLLGHGSGSFGHRAAAQYGTHLGAKTDQDWKGFAAVWKAAHSLDSIVVEALVSAGLPAVAFPPSASGLSTNGALISVANQPIEHALAAGLLPVVYGDVVFDTAIGASIASTEEVFLRLAESIKPGRVLLAGRAEGVYETSGQERKLIQEITPDTRDGLQFESPEGEDVTGGMATKVDLCLELASNHPGLEILIFSAEQPGRLKDVLTGQKAGTRIRA
jgi:isopentenyl phosphate kinase